ncbi:MAG: hypothetical protein B7Y31_01310, partial [Novosphingobium sp. 16-62-11]
MLLPREGGGLGVVAQRQLNPPEAPAFAGEQGVFLFPFRSGTALRIALARHRPHTSLMPEPHVIAAILWAVILGGAGGL